MPTKTNKIQQDLNNLQSLNLVLEQKATASIGSRSLAELVYDTDLNVIKYKDAAGIKTLASTSILGALALKATIDSAALIDNGIITEVKLHADVQTKLNANSALNNLVATTDPSVGDDTGDGYSVNSLWMNQSSLEVFRCMDATLGAAVWVKTTLTIDELGALAVKNTIDSASLIASNVVTVAKLEQVDRYTILGRTTTGTGNVEKFQATEFGFSLLDDADAAAGRTTLGAQALNARLTDISGLAATDGGIIVGDGTNFVLESGATARASLGLVIGTNVSAQTKVFTFEDTDFADASGDDYYTLTQATHGITAGKFTIEAVEENDGTNYVKLDSGILVYEVIASGDVKIKVATGNGFDGRIKLKEHA